MFAMADEPTPKQKRILDLIAEHFDAEGFAPSLRDIAGRLGVSSGTVQRQIEALEHKGFLNRREGTARGLFLSGLPAGELPILGRVGAGRGPIAQEDIQGYFSFKDFRLGADYLLKVKGDSMEGAGILEGDLVQVRRQPTAEDGDVVVAVADGEDGVVKRLRRRGGSYRLESANPKYGPILYGFQIVGLVVGLVRQYGH